LVYLFWNGCWCWLERTTPERGESHLSDSKEATREGDLPRRQEEKSKAQEHSGRELF